VATDAALTLEETHDSAFSVASGDWESPQKKLNFIQRKAYEILNIDKLMLDISYRWIGPLE